MSIDSPVSNPTRRFLNYFPPPSPGSHVDAGGAGTRRGVLGRLREGAFLAGHRPLGAVLTGAHRKLTATRCHFSHEHLKSGQRSPLVKAICVGCDSLERTLRPARAFVGALAAPEALSLGSPGGHPRAYGPAKAAPHRPLLTKAFTAPRGPCQVPTSSLLTPTGAVLPLQRQSLHDLMSPDKATIVHPRAASLLPTLSLVRR